MGETHHQRATTSSRLGMMRTGGEIVEVQGGHIVRSTGRKDRHSKVCTAKGPRDRRVRLSAYTAIQFYDVQDRLGYDRPSKAVDWLIKKAKAAIDELAQLPAWNPSATCSSALHPNAQQQLLPEEEEQQINENSEEPIIGGRGVHVDAASIASGSRRAASTAVGGGGRISEHFQLQQHLGDNNNNKYNSGSSGFLPPSLDTDIADTIKSFFPMVAAAAETTTSFHNYPPQPDLLSRTTSSTINHQDLRLSLQSFQDPILLHHQQQQQHHHHHHQHEQVLFAGTTALGFDGGSSGWSEQQHHPEEHEHEHGRLHRMVAWNAAAASDTGNSGHGGAGGGGGGGGGGFIFNTPSPSPVSLFGHGQYLSQRGPLQSSNTPSIRAWVDPSIATATDHHHHHHYLSPATHHQSSISGGGIGFAASGGFSGFRIPARIQGEEEHDGVSDQPSSASSDSRH